MVANSVPFSPLAIAQARMVLLGPPEALFCRILDSVRSLKGSDVIWIDGLFSEEQSRGTSAGTVWAKAMAQGSLAPDEIVLGVLRHRFWSRKSNRGFLVAGAPATVGQLSVFESWLDERDESLTAAVVIRPSREQSLAKAEEGGSDLQRSRQQVGYGFAQRRAAVEPVAEHFRRQGLLLELDSTEPIESNLAVLHESLSSLLADR